MGKKILVVDDDEMVRRTFVRLMRTMGCEVVEASCGGEAFPMIEDDSSIVLVLTDVDMSGGSGIDLHTAVCNLLSERGVRFIACSGNARHRSYFEEAGVPFLDKPVSPRKLLCVVENVLGD